MKQLKVGAPIAQFSRTKRWVLKTLSVSAEFSLAPRAV